jgi:uncharacterized membrane-anchored protein
MPRLVSRLLSSVIAVASVLFLLLTPLSSPALAADPPTIDWIPGPRIVDLGSVASVNMGSGYIFANAKDTQELLKYVGEPYDESNLGLVAPDDQVEQWGIFFSYAPIGYVKDDEKESLDPAKLLDAMRKGVEEGNKIRTKNGTSALKVMGWYEEPHYDSITNNLTWVVLFEEVDTGSPLVNYNTRLLGRYGYMGVVLVTDPDALESDKAHAADIVAGFSWKSGKGYAEWKPGDRVAEIGLTALVAGGAGAIAAKTGLLAKLWKPIAIGAAAVGAAIVRFFNRLRGKRKTPGPDVTIG